MKARERPFYYNASSEILKRAEVLRKQMTAAEVVLWNRLRKSKIKNQRFRPQHPIGKFIVDFYCHEALLVIELDGEIHNDEVVAERDEGRESEIKKLGITIIRFSNKEVLEDSEKVIEVIGAHLKERTKEG